MLTRGQLVSDSRFKKFLAGFRENPYIQQKELMDMYGINRYQVEYWRKKARSIVSKPEKPKTKQRECIGRINGKKCGKIIESTWAGHRLCPDCRENRRYFRDIGTPMGMPT